MTSNLTDPPESPAPPTIAFAQPGPQGQRYRTIRVPDYGPHLEILTLHWPISREMLAAFAFESREAFADHAGRHIAERVRELITEWKSA